MTPASFVRDIRPMFRQIDVEHMSKHNILLDDYTYMSDPSNDHGHAQAVEDSLVQQTMPPGGPYWSAQQLSLYKQWRSDGYQP
jgi:hypothetical protein